MTPLPTISDYALMFGLNPDTARPLGFHRHEYLLGPLDDLAPRVVLMKGAQVGATVLAVLRALAAQSAEESDPADGAALVGDAAPPVQAAPAGPDAEAPPERPAPGEAPIDDRPHRAAGRGATLTPSEAGTR